ncbi:MAG: DUF6088 family protein [Candidatus Hydrogenedentales bacterium]
MSTTESIREKVLQYPLGHPIMLREFLAYGGRAAVDQALARLVRVGILTRPARGVYTRPKRNPYVGEVFPEPMKVAEAIARETGSAVQVHGAEAARRMGFTTQVPNRPIFYTSGPNRRFRLGEMEVVLKHVSPRKLALAGRPAGVALTALWYLGKDAVDAKTIEHVHAQLTPEEFTALMSVSFLMPGWMHDAFMRHGGRRSRA